MGRVLEELKKGNKKFVASTDKKGLKKHARVQKPMAAILTCSDSRVIPELIFDKGIGGLFVVRIAGNVATDQTVIESLEYAVENLGVEFVLVLGHTGCGAVAACEKNPKSDKRLLTEIRASFSICPDHVVSNVRRQANSLPKRSRIISKAVRRKKLIIKCAIYNIETGAVTFLNG
jgi:carbonic anhydrase